MVTITCPFNKKRECGTYMLTVPLTRWGTKAASPVPVQRRAGVRQVQGGQQGREVHLSA
jgi:hypothetical protein